MTRMEVSFDDYDAECLRFLTEYFDKHGENVAIRDFPRYAELGHDHVLKVVDRFRRFQMIKLLSRSTVTILPQLISVAEQLRNPSKPDKELKPLQYDIFISYASLDSALASELRTQIEMYGLTTFMAEKDIAVATPWKQVIRDALRSCSRVLIVLTPNSIHRPWVLVETGAAWALDKEVIPTMAFVNPNDFVDPLKDIQARRIETTEQRTALVAEIVGKKAT